MRDLKYLLLLCVTLWGCASKLNPTGGPKDVTPPTLVSVVPADKSTMFTGHEIVFTFSEYVQLTDLQNQLVVSPIIEPAPVVKVYKREVIVALPDSLRSNTTYTLNFGKAVADVNEGNAYEGLRYVFSTGAVLDSFRLSGYVTDAATQKTTKGLTVMLYRTLSMDDSIIFRRKPDYFARTTDDGAYSINNLAAGTYMLTALDDKNSNYVYDDPAEEAIAFADKLINVNGDTTTTALRMALSKPATARIKNVLRPDKVTAVIALSRPVTNLQVRNYNTNDQTKHATWLNASGDTLMIFAQDSLQDSLKLILSGDHQLNDTLLLQMQSKNSRDKNPFRLTADIHSFPTADDKSLMLRTLHSVVINKDRFVLTEDSLQKTAFDVRTDSVSQLHLRITAGWKPGSNYQLMLLPGAIRDTYNLANDTLRYSFHIPGENETGVVSVKVTAATSGNYLLQLCSTDFKVIRQQHMLNSGTVTFGQLLPGTYKLRVVNDENGNGRYDTGSWPDRVQPERVKAGEDLQVRANWELESDISIP